MSICSIRTKLTLSWRVSLIMMILGKFIIQRRVKMEVPRVIQNIGIWHATIVIKRGILELIVGFKRRNNQMPMSLNRLEKMKNSATFYLFTDKSVINKDRWIIDFECSQYISFNRKKFSSYTLVQRGEVFLENSATRNMIGEGTI